MRCVWCERALPPSPATASASDGRRFQLHNPRTGKNDTCLVQFKDWFELKYPLVGSLQVSTPPTAKEKRQKRGSRSR